MTMLPLQYATRPTHWQFWLWLALLAGGWPAAAQDPFGGDDPFGSSPPATVDPFGSTPPSADGAMDAFGGAATRGQPPAATAADTSQPDPDPVVRLLRSSPPKSVQQWSDALTWMVRIKRWDEVKRLLNELQAAGWTVEQQAELARTAGSSLWVRLRVREAELSEEQSQFVGELLSAPAQLARDPAAIDAWIQQLASPQAGERRLAQLRLQDGGTASVQSLVDHLLAGDTAVDPVMLAGTLVEFGPEGIPALRAACLVGDPQRAARVVMALPPLKGHHFTAELGAALLSRRLPAEARSQLSTLLLEKYGSLPTANRIQDHLARQFDEALANYQLKRGSEDSIQIPVWRPTADGQTVVPTMAPVSAQPLERLAQLAALRLDTTDADSQTLVAAMAALLQRAYQVQPSLEAGELHSHLLVSIDEQLAADAEYWQAVYAQAGAWQMHGAALRAVQLLAEYAAEARYLPPLDFLSQLLNDPRPVIRYSALQAIATIDPAEPYLGAEQAVATAIEMNALAGGPHTLVIGLESQLRQAASQQLMTAVGADVTEVNSGQAALLALAGNVPIELIVIVDRVADMSLFELMQRLRNSQHGRSLPVAVLTDRLYQHERQLIGETAGVAASVLSRDPAQLQRVVAGLLDKLDTQPMSPADRGVFSRAAGQFLAQIASDRKLYAFYPLADFRDHLVVAQGGMSPAAQIEVVAALGSAESQQKLVDWAATGSLDKQQRLTAARAFGKSVRRFGMLLDRTSVFNCYELYNQLGPQDAVAAQALGLILDVAEAHAGKAEWPEGL